MPTNCTVEQILELWLTISTDFFVPSLTESIYLRMSFVVDNTKSGGESECPEVMRLREKLLTVAKCLPHMKKAVPLKWLKYENVLQCLRNEKYRYITIEKAHEIASDKCGINDNEQFQIMLDFLHDQKVLIHFKEKQLNTLVILDPQWLIDIFKKVITIS